MRRHLLLLTILALIFALIFAGSFSLAHAQAKPGKTRTTLDVYVIDVEGGNAVLFVSPSGESILMDTGNVPPGAVRDAGRIMAAVRDAGLTQIDHLIITHWHGDHFGGLAELAPQIPIREFIDHGPNVQPGAAADEFLQKTYPQIIAKANAKHTVAKPGDKIHMAGVDVLVVASAGEIIKTPLPGGGKPNPYCADFKPGENNAEDPQSVGIHITFGKFRAVHLGDLTKNKEFELMCPNNRLGTVDVLLGLHHGQASSNSPVMVWALHPRVAIMNDGTRKGGEPETMQTVHSSPGPRRSLAAAFLAAQRPGVHPAGNVHRQYRRRPAAGHAHRSHAGAATRARRTSSAGAQWHGLLDQAVGPAQRQLHRNQHAQRLLQNLQVRARPKLNTLESQT